MRFSLMTTLCAGTVLLAACGGQTTDTPIEADAVPAETATPVALTVTILDCGTIEISDLDIFSTEGDYAGLTDTFSDTCWLINHPDGRLLWDLGLPGILKEGGPQQNGVFTVSLEKTITDQLREMDLTPTDIDYLAISHSHFDHIGQITQFPDATWIVNETELAAMFPPEGTEQTSADQVGMFALFDPLKKDVFTGEKDVFGDGSVIIFQTPGHTPGHTSLQVNLPEMGPILLTGDLYHRSESRELGRVPSFNFDVDKTRESITAFEARATELGAKVIIQHEPADIEPLGTTLK